MDDLEHYAPRKPEVLDSVGRFIRIYAPDLRCENGSFLECAQNGITEKGAVIRQVGNQRFDIDLLGGRLEKGELKITLLEDVFSVKIETTSMKKLRWQKGAVQTHCTFPIGEKITLDSSPIDNIAPIKRGATHLVFYNEAHPIVVSTLVKSVTKKFTSSAFYYSNEVLEGLEARDCDLSFTDDTGQHSVDVFAAFTSNSDLAWLDCSYSPEFCKQLVEFEKLRNPTTTVLAFVKTGEDVFPIIESLSFGNIEALWVIDEHKRLDPTRTRTRIFEGDQKRAEIMRAISEYREEKFEADLLGEPFEKEIPFPEMWEPIF